MRVIAGLAKGRVLVAPKGRSVRPTAQHVKESVFNILADRACEGAVLDLFAGSGSLGIESLSRGASECVFVDSDQRSIEAIERNLLATQLSDRSRVCRMDVYRAIGVLEASSSRYSLVFADPPYEKGHEQRLLMRLCEGRILLPSSTVVLEHSCRTETPVAVGCLTRESLRTYGDTHVSLYVYSAEGRV
jgi:16S rRNA (guanine966-N2)-methyltransferase